MLEVSHVTGGQLYCPAGTQGVGPAWVFTRYSCKTITKTATAPRGDCLPWTDRLGTRFLDRCLGSNQVHLVPSSSDGGRTIPL